ncbi:GHMP kinase C terminal family protein [Candidatus Endolissoclinum faulkneri L2]|uniref:4-diphosphocytidyl-2-C-methyl-D-erythritol kinase n=1 Tax=Candidatus Endolissoclinum faulkneri L2 TaxID=1193729 RepID=K7Z3H7_9PROT|nr:4-(cytidine 5'-diphospho)-2-C-methyl-D-erythritol kinase [Candidatus Endolissoclinum faulkneri]AFX98528.1 GHMP kinase C terminal family protein [Candidatus Endolissoclinum faulkneri L2]
MNGSNNGVLSKVNACPRIRLSPAKVNLALHLIGRRSDGYHFIDTLVAFADFGDWVTWRTGGSACLLEVKDCFNRSKPIPKNTANLAWQALSIAGRISNFLLSGSLTVEKFLPSGAGIGGGSSNAATVMHLILEDVNINKDSLYTKALMLGSDVPVCLAGCPTRVEGVGERLTTITLAKPLPVVMVWPGASLSTASVFRYGKFNDYGNIPARAIECLATDPLSAIASLRNDLECISCCLLPAVRQAMFALQNCSGCRVARMSGSGSVVVGYFENYCSANAAAKMLTFYSPSWWVRACTLLI